MGIDDLALGRIVEALSKSPFWKDTVIFVLEDDSQSGPDHGERTIPSAYSGRREGIDGEEVNEPLDGFLWTLARKKKISFRDYGEMMKAREGWPVTQRELAPDTSPTYSPFDLKIPDQERADAWIAELQTFIRNGEMPQLEIMHLPSERDLPVRQSS